MDSYTYMELSLFVIALVVLALTPFSRRKAHGPPPMKPPRYTRTPPIK